MPPPSAEVGEPTGGAVPDVWYVRPASGGQYGPATTDVLRTWLAEGRVADDSWVWRTGWPEWKSGQEATELLDAQTLPLPMSDPAAASPEAPERMPKEIVEDQDLGSTIPAKQRRSAQRSRRDRARLLTIALGAVVLMLVVTLVVILLR